MLLFLKITRLVLLKIDFFKARLHWVDSGEIAKSIDHAFIGLDFTKVSNL